MYGQADPIRRTDGKSSHYIYSNEPAYEKNGRTFGMLACDLYAADLPGFPAAGIPFGAFMRAPLRWRLLPTRSRRRTASRDFVKCDLPCNPHSVHAIAMRTVMISFHVDFHSAARANDGHLLWCAPQFRPSSGDMGRVPIGHSKKGPITEIGTLVSLISGTGAMQGYTQFFRIRRLPSLSGGTCMNLQVRQRFIRHSPFSGAAARMRFPCAAR